MVSTSPNLPPPIDATLSVTRAARVLGVHANTVRAWSDDGRLRYYRINARGDRRYRLTDLQRFLATFDDGHRPGSPAHDPRDARRIATSRRPGDLPELPVGAAEHPGADIDSGEHQATVALLQRLADIGASAVGEVMTDPDALLAGATGAIRDATGAVLASLWRLDGQSLVPVAVSGTTVRALVPLPAGYGVLGAALAASPAVVEADPARYLSATNQPGTELACAVPCAGGPDGEPWGVLLLVLRAEEATGIHALVTVAARAVATIVRAAASASEVAHRLHRAEALRRVAADIGSRLDLDEILNGLIDHAGALFGAQHAAVTLFDGDGGLRVAASRGLSQAWMQAIGEVRGNTFGQAAIEARRPIFSVGYRDDPRVGELRAAVVQEGFDTACLAPLLDGSDAGALGLLGVYHDRPHPWTPDELETMEALANQASVAIRSAQAYTQLSTWAAQLQSIQHLGARLNRLTSVGEIGEAIAKELRQLIDYHNVRVYRLYGEDLIPVAMLGRVGEYQDETPDQLKVKYGQGITGWVAEHRAAQLLDDAAADSRANTIPGTDEDLAESMLLAPMLFEDQVLGVLVLSKLGLRQFRQDDLRLLEIYASFAAQAMATADSTERLREKSAALEQKVRSQRELLANTETMLTTLDAPLLLEQMVDRLGLVVASDNVAVELIDAELGRLEPVIARGRDAAYYLEPWQPGETGLATWVQEHNEPVLLIDEYDDDRVLQQDRTPIHGSLVCVPLRGRSGAIGVLTLERLGEGRPFSEDEFELVQLFAAHASIALQNAEVYSAVRMRAQTDPLTGVLNHGSFVQQLDGLIQAGDRFSLVMLDLDGFKSVNDRMGHQAGDTLLRQVAQAIVAASRENDRVFRYGGDEFVVLLPRTDGSHLGPIAERIRSAVASVVAPNTAWFRRVGMLAASAGTASFPADGHIADEVLLAADRALFAAKRAGGGRVATSRDGMALAGEFTLQAPTPIDPLASTAA